MISQIVKFNVKPDHSQAFKYALLEEKKVTEQEAGYVEIRLFTDTKNPNIFFAHERWEDQEAVDNHREQPYPKKICSMVNTMLKSPVEVFNLGETKPGPQRYLNKTNRIRKTRSSTWITLQ